MTTLGRRRRSANTTSSVLVRRQQEAVSTRYKSKGIAAPHSNDVLMGRGGKNNQHSGNETLRKFARQRCEDYRRASKKGKSDISRELVRIMRELEPPAR